MEVWIRDGYCAVCGKYFIIPPENVYKRVIKGEVKNLCSYSCMRKVDRENEAKKKCKKPRKEG